MDFRAMLKKFLTCHIVTLKNKDPHRDSLFKNPPKYRFLGNAFFYSFRDFPVNHGVLTTLSVQNQKQIYGIFILILVSKHIIFGTNRRDRGFNYKYSC